MMVEPPRQTVRGRVFEINDGVLVAVEHLFVKERARAMQEARGFNIRRRGDARFVEARENRRRGHAVKTVAVIKDAKFHESDVCLSPKMIARRAILPNTRVQPSIKEHYDKKRSEAPAAAT